MGDSILLTYVVVCLKILTERPQPRSTKKKKSLCIPTFRSLSFLRLHSSHSLTMRPHRIQVSSSRWDRLEEAEELDTSEEPLLRREPLIDRMDLESASSNLRPERVDQDEELRLHVMVIDESDNSDRINTASHPRLRS